MFYNEFLDGKTLNEAARQLLDVNLDWKEDLQEKIKEVGLDDLKGYVQGSLGAAAGRQYVSIPLSGEDDEDGKDGRRRIRVRSRGRVGSSLKVVWEFAKGTTEKMVRIRRVSEFIGEVGTRMVSQAMGFEDLDLRWENPKHGPDVFTRHPNLKIWGMFEAKGGSSKLSKDAKYGKQMNHSWIEHWYNEVGKTHIDDTDAETPAARFDD